MTATDETRPRREHAGLRVRPARPDDAPEIAALIRTSEDLAQVSPDEIHPLTPETVRHWIENRRSGYVLEQRGRIAGYAELVDDARNPDRVWIGHMMVASSQRGLGLGKTLVRALQEVAEHDRDVHEVAISAFADNRRALQCYRGCDFVDRGVHRVHDRDLVELRYRVPGRRPVHHLVPSLVLGLVASIVALVLAGPSAWDAVVAVPVASLTLLAAWALHAVLPVHRDGVARRTLRTAIYVVSVAATGFGVAAVMGLATAVDLGRAALVAGTGAVLWAAGLVAHGALQTKRSVANP